MIEQISNQAEIENLFKSGLNAPYTKAGYGYKGVLLVHKETGQIHCHICGEWFTSLGHHSAKKHGIKSREYKILYGFSLTQPLCSQELSKTYRAITLKNIENGIMTNKGGDKERMKKMSKIAARKRKQRNNHFTDSKLNDKNICNEQLKRRVFAIAENEGKDISSYLINEKDSGLLSTILRRFGSWNSFLSQNNISTSNKFHSVSSDVMLIHLREFWVQYKTIPSTTVWKKRYKKHGWVTESSIIRKFGSWNRALTNAGLVYQQVA